MVALEYEDDEAAQLGLVETVRLKVSAWRPTIIWFPLEYPAGWAPKARRSRCPALDHVNGDVREMRLSPDPTAQWQEHYLSLPALAGLASGVPQTRRRQPCQFTAYNSTAQSPALHIWFPRQGWPTNIPSTARTGDGSKRPPETPRNRPLPSRLRNDHAAEPVLHASGAAAAEIHVSSEIVVVAETHGHFEEEGYQGRPAACVDKFGEVVVAESRSVLKGDWRSAPLQGESPRRRRKKKRHFGRGCVCVCVCTPHFVML